jgi:mannose-6-phosphate isomerase-like protein (cupin superfamily)
LTTVGDVPAGEGNGIAAGSWLHNPATGELARVNATADDTAGRRIETDLWLQPGAAVVGAHVHDSLIERFEVLEGEVGFQVAGEERVSRPGDGEIEVAAGVVHDWWNLGRSLARVRVTVEVVGPPGAGHAARFASLVETLWSLGALGRVNAKGLPDPLWLAAIAHEYRDVTRFTRPPALLQSALFPPLAALARRTGRDPLAPELHGPGAPCVIPEPSEARFRELLERPVKARAARRRG